MSGFSVHLHWLFVCHCHAAFITKALWYNFKFKMMRPPTVLLLFGIVFTALGLLSFYKKLKMAVQGLWRIVLEFCWGMYWICWLLLMLVFKLYYIWGINCSTFLLHLNPFWHSSSRYERKKVSGGGSIYHFTSPGCLGSTEASLWYHRPPRIPRSRLSVCVFQTPPLSLSLHPF